LAKAGCPVSKLLNTRITAGDDDCSNYCHSGACRRRDAALLILRSGRREFIIGPRFRGPVGRVSKDEPNLWFRDGAKAPPHHEGAKAPTALAAYISASPFGPTEAMRSMLVVPGGAERHAGDDD